MHIFFVRIFVLVFFAINLHADDEGFAKIKFFSPKVEKRLEGTFVRISINGFVQDAGTFSINEKETYVLSNKKVFRLSLQQLSPEIIKSNSTGTFKILLNVPKGLLNIGLRFHPHSGSSQEYGLAYNLTNNKIESSQGNELIKVLSKTEKIEDFFDSTTASSKPSESQKKIYNNIISLGVGYNFLRYDQKYSSPFTSDLSYESFKGPGYYLSYLHQYNPHWQLSFEIKNALGEASTGNQTTVRQGSYVWIIANAEALYFTHHGEFLGYTARFPLRFGIQQHIVPFIERVALNEVSISNNEITYATLGYGVDLFSQSEVWDFQFYMRFQIPMRYGSGFKIKTSQTFDGSMGINRKIAEEWSLGCFWYGQYQYLEFDGARDHVSAVDDSQGSQVLLYSNFELRLSYFW